MKLLQNELLKLFKTKKPSIKVFSVVNQMLFFSDYFVEINNPGELMLSIIVNLAYVGIFYLLAVTMFKKKDILC